MRKDVVGIVAAALALLCFCLLSPPEGLSVAGFRAIGIMLAACILWLTEALPITITALLTVALIPTLGVLSFSEVCSSSVNQAFYFVLGSFGICAALAKLPLPLRIMRIVLLRFGNDPKRIVFGFVLLGALFSLFVSDSAAVMLSIGFALTFLEKAGLAQASDSRLAKCIMLGIPAGAMAGGIATPISNSVNILAIGILETNVGVSIDFIHWMMVGVPLAVVMTCFSTWALCHFFKPESILDSQWDSFVSAVRSVPKWSSQETKFLLILACMVGLWIASSWIETVNIASVSLIGIAVMLLPGVKMFSGREYVETVKLDAVILIPTTSVLAAAISQSGAGEWIVQTIFAGSAAWPAMIILLVAAVVGCIAHILIPIGPSVVSITMATVFPFAWAAGVDPCAICIVLAIWGGVTYTLPLDGLYVLTYGYGFYKTKDLAAYGVLPTAAWLVLCVTLVPALCVLL